MARRHFEQLPAERQREILDVAAAEFARTGYRETSYNRLLERLGLGKSSAYYYFDDKRDLFLTVLRRCYASIVERLGKLPRPTTAAEFWPFVHRATVLSYEHVLADPVAGNLARCLQKERELLGELTATDVVSVMTEINAEVIRHGQALGVVRTDLPPRLLLEIVINVSATFDAWFVAERAGGRRGPSPKRAADLFTDAMRRLCAPDEGAKAPRRAKARSRRT